MSAVKIMTCKGTSGLGKVARAILNSHADTRVFAFFGQMGAGKTTLIKELCRELGVSETVSSPTFAIINVYSGRDSDIYHFDFYRIKKTEEIFDIGYEDYFFSGQYCFIEWPELINNFLPPGTIRVKIDVDPGDDSRNFTF
jgi:tRNA threonylcarbamoyladenosine biosynthesis protein TsaE